MNPKSIFNPFKPKGTAPAGTQQGLATLLISIVTLSLLALTVSIRLAQASGPEPGEQPTIEMLRNIDPADRKFLTPGYGTQVVMPSESEALPTIDPADRKFFNAGYGTQNIGADKPGAVLPTTVNELGNPIPIWFLLK